MLQELALDAVQTVAQDLGGGLLDVDVKNYAKVEKIPGGTIEECKVNLLLSVPHTKPLQEPNVFFDMGRLLVLLRY